MKCLECQLDNLPDAVFCVHCTASLKSVDETQAYNQNISSTPRYNLSHGYIFADKYEIMEKLGGGGMGVVYKARDIKLKRFVALKLLPPELTRDDEARERFTQEAQAASILDHPNICTIHEIDEDKEDKMFIAMACYQGETVHKRIKRGPLPINEIIEIAIQVAQGLEQAHSKGIMHRDIKPSNLIITESGLVKIVDFGLAKLADITRTSTVMGTAAYMSPEQAGGKEVDHRTDLWSLGVVIYEMTTSCLPFPQVNVPALIHAILNDTPPAPREVKSEIPEDLDRIILRCMRKQPEDRFSTARVLISRLEKARRNLMRPSKLAEAAAPYKPYKMEEKKEQERRLATVMFVEISGINEILSTREEEEMVAVMGRCLGLLNDISSKYGGVLNKITGSRFSIFFGIPKAIEDAPKRAVNAAIELRNKVNDLNQKEKLNIHLDVQIGINTGIVFTGALSEEEKNDYSIMGETVVLASHLKDISREGQIFASPMTYRHTKKKFEFRETKKTIPFKGKVKSIPVYELLSIKEKIYRAGSSTERMIYSELVGREEELAKLELYVLKAMNEEGSVISLIGEAGIGKSRLIAELKNKEAVQRTMLLQGRALSIGRNFSFHPIIDVLKSWAGIKEDDTAIESFHKLEKRIRFVYPEGINEVFPFVATLMGMKLSGKYADRVKGIEGEALEKLLLKNFRDLLTKAAAQKTVVFIMEDLHWADLSSLKLL